MKARYTSGMRLGSPILWLLVAACSPAATRAVEVPALPVASCRVVAIVDGRARTQPNDEALFEHLLDTEPALPVPYRAEERLRALEVVRAAGPCRTPLASGSVIEYDDGLAVEQALADCPGPRSQLGFTGCAVDPGLRYATFEHTSPAVPYSEATGDPLLDRLFATGPPPHLGPSIGARRARVSRVAVADEWLVVVEVSWLADEQRCTRQGYAMAFYLERGGERVQLTAPAEHVTITGVYHDGQHILALEYQDPWGDDLERDCDGRADCRTVEYARLEGDRLVPTGSAAYDTTSGNLTGVPSSALEDPRDCRSP